MDQEDSKPTQPDAADEIPPVDEPKNPGGEIKQAIVVDPQREEISKLKDTPMERVSPPRKINLLASFNQTSTVSKNRAKIEEFVADLKDRAEQDQKEDAAK
eukprot:8247943-Karenia_brevis.AAC.1